jgi:uncharacterized membrane protein YjjP (DUF1212 family)
MSTPKDQRARPRAEPGAGLPRDEQQPVVGPSGPGTVGHAPTSPIPAAAARPRRARRRIWRGELPTEPIPLVESLRRTPYRNIRVAQVAAEEREARASMDLALRVGELMLRCGADAPQVESSVVAVAAAAGLDNLEIDITLQSLLMQCQVPSGGQITMLRVVRSASRDFSRLVAVHQFVEELVAGDFDREEAARKLREIRRAPRFWPRWVVHLASGVFAGAVALMLGAGIVAALIAGLSTLLVDKCYRELGNRGLPEFYACALGGAIATTIAWAAYAVGVQGWLPVSGPDFAYMVAGGIVVLLPGRTVAAAFEDVISGYSVTGAGRILGVLLTTAGIIIGVAGALSLTFRVGNALSLDVVVPGVTDLRASDAPLLLGAFGGAVVGLSGAVTLRSRRSMVLPAGLLCALGVVLSSGISVVLGLGALTSVGIAAVVLGFLGRMTALQMGAPAMALVVPASYGLLPGLAIFRGLYEMVTSAGPSSGSLSVAGGITTLLGAMAVLLAIATGTVLGEYLASPFDHGIVQKRRARRR